MDYQFFKELLGCKYVCIQVTNKRLCFIIPWDVLKFVDEEYP